MATYPGADSDRLKTARARYKMANEADAPQDEREREDSEFAAGSQWPPDIKLARMGQQPTAGQPAVPARPTLVIDKTREPINQVLNQERNADIGIELVPADDFGDLGITPDDTEITLREGLIRRIQRESHAADARSWAYKRAVIAGRGYYLVSKRYLPGKTFDQEIYLERIYDQRGVKLDPSHTMPDGSDALWGFIGDWMSAERIQSEYATLANGDKNPLAACDDAAFIGMSESYPTWWRIEGEGDQKRIDLRRARYWYQDTTHERIAILEDGSIVDADQVPEGVTPVDTREVPVTTVQYCVILGGVQIVEETEWGPDMPIVKVIGEELVPYDEQRRFIGMVRPSRDPQMGYNFMISKWVEQIGLTPIPPLMLDPVAIQGYEEVYKVANTRTLMSLPYRSYDDQGRELRPPMRPPVDPNLTPLVQSVQLFDQSIKSTTAIPDPTLGNVDPSLKSGRAIREVVANAALSTSHYLDNLVRSMKREGDIINNLLYPIYGTRPGRLVRTMTGEGESQTMRVGEGATSAAQAAKAAKNAKLTKDAKFNLIIKVTKAFESRRTQEASIIAELLSANPELMTWFGDLFFKNQDGPGHVQMAERAKVMLAPPIQQMLAAKEQGQEPLPPEVQAALAQKDQQIQMAEAALKQLDEERKGKVIENQTKLQVAALEAQRDHAIEQMRAQTDLEKERMKNATAIAVAEINARAKGAASADEEQMKALALAHEAHENELDRQHEQAVAEQQAANQAAMAGATADVQGAEAERQRQHEAEMQANAPVSES